MNTTPILYSFRRCPYAMRARLGLFAADIRFEWREILLRGKPAQFLEASKDATVPVLLLKDRIIQESLDILKWAVEMNAPQLLSSHDPELIAENDGAFKSALDRYKYASRYEDGVGDAARDEASPFIFALENRLEGKPYLNGDQISVNDLAILPFIRQFAHVDLNWFNAQSWPNAIRWLDDFKASDLFLAIMEKRPPWKEGDPAYII